MKLLGTPACLAWRVACSDGLLDLPPVQVVCEVENTHAGEVIEALTLRWGLGVEGWVSD